MDFKTVRCWIKGELVIFDKYEVNEVGCVRNKKTKYKVNITPDDNGYKSVGIVNMNKRFRVKLHRIIISTFSDQIPKDDQTIDHLNRNRGDNTLNNLTWKTPTEQCINQERSKSRTDAFIIIKDGVEKTAKEWSELTGKSVITIQKRAQHNIKGFSYKEYTDLFGEIWKDIGNGNKVSNYGRYGIYKNNNRKVFFPFELGCLNGYPRININGKPSLLHIVIFKTFNPDIYNNKSKKNIILHNNDNKMDCSITNLRIGTRSENGSDAHNNGKYDGTKTCRKPCVGIHKNTGKRVEFESLKDAEKWLMVNGYPKARYNNIRKSIQNKIKFAYDHIWQEL
ncbi:hypothetical protein PBCVKS1B_633R [Paramecium bursaria Chlorella virus KS1B]|nr:hypothetical protein PBCVKS1B_633R [Paramecium bursaria Chlorella virus KS1B]